MKIAFIVFILLSAGAASNANPGKLSFISSSTSSEVYKLSVIEVQLEEARTFVDIQKVLLLMIEFAMPVVDTCEVPKAADFKALCADISSHAKVTEKSDYYIEYTWERRILFLACVNFGVDDEELIKRKVQTWWNKYKLKCKCDSAAFALQNGHLLKFAISQNMFDVIETLSSTYGCNINFIDPSDGLNIYDYIVSEIIRLKKLGNSANIVRVYEEYRDAIIGLGGKSNK
jgi:hypothetical protein